MKVHLGMNLLYAAKRFPEPDVWGQQIGERWGLKHVQFVYDLLDPRTIPAARDGYCEAVNQAAAKYGFAVHNCFIGVAAYTYNYLLHPFPAMRDDALDWCDKAAAISTSLGSKGVGGPIAAASWRDYTDRGKRQFLMDTLVAGFQSFARIAAARGQEFLIWEPTPVGREMSISIDTVHELYNRMNRGSAIPIRLQLDVGHWCSYEQKGKDADLDCWLRELGPFSPIFHVQQMDGKNDVHWSFSKKNNARGVIKMEKVLETLRAVGCMECYLYPEIGFAYEMDEEALLVEMDETVAYLKSCL
jgi:sugar phosphate isomerase/epimerase